MAKYTISHSCGHDSGVELFGPGKDRERKIKYLEDQLCSACALKAKQDRDEKDAAEAAANYPDLPTLEGSEEQVKWGAGIRARAIASIAQAVGRHAEFAEFGRRMLRQKSAKYWIDRRKELVNADTVAQYIVGRMREEAAQAAGREALGL